MVEKINKTIALCFYLIFFFVPLAVSPSTYELFEFNKMWTVFGITLIILFLWISKIIITQKFEVKRTPFDIPILLFLFSQLISTIYSIDSSVSFWGYYSRFNGGFLSTLSYTFLYFAFSNNLLSQNKLVSYRILLTTLFSGIIVAFWGFPSHFGYDPTCLMFRGSLDVSCWTDAFQPKVRIFSTLGQPNWLAAYLSIVLPLLIAFILYKFQSVSPFKKIKNIFKMLVLSLILIICYLDLIFTNSQSGFSSFAIGLIIFIVIYLFVSFKTSIKNPDDKPKLLPGIFNLFKTNNTTKIFASIILIIFLLTFFAGTPIAKINTFTFANIKNSLIPKTQEIKTKTPTIQPVAPSELGGTDSMKIRSIVWRGAIEIFKKHPIFGTGVETFAYAYYQERPKEHNLTSEWDYLYNKAHNEYLNYLATSGAFGFLTYMFFIFSFLFFAIKNLIREEQNKYVYFKIALLSGYISTLISNFFGFSVVITNLYIFLIPVLFYDLSITSKKQVDYKSNTGFGKILLIVIVAIIILNFELFLIRYWIADTKYALGYNLNRAGEYTTAYSDLKSSVELQPSEDLYKNELSVTLSTLSLYLLEQKDTTNAAKFADEAKRFSDYVLNNHPNNITYLKTRTRVLYTISQVNKDYFRQAVQSIEEAHRLAPTDAKLVYNMALLYNQDNQKEKAMETLKEAINLKPDYRDAYFAIASIYAEMSKEEEGKNFEKSENYKLAAEKALKYTLEKIDPQDTQAKELLKTVEKK